MLKIKSSGLCRGVVDSYALSCFHEDVGLGDFPAIWHIKRADAVVEICDPLGGNAVLVLFGMIHFNVVDQLRHHRRTFFCNQVSAQDGTYAHSMDYSYRL